MAIFEETEIKEATTVGIVSGTNINGPERQIKEDNSAFQIEITKNSGTLAGTLKLQGKVIQGYSWVDVAGGEQDLSDANGSFIWNVRGYGINYCRVVIVPTDTANITYKIGHSSKI